jgi:PKD repeat protein
MGEMQKRQTRLKNIFSLFLILLLTIPLFSQIQPIKAEEQKAFTGTFYDDFSADSGMWIFVKDMVNDSDWKIHSASEYRDTSAKYMVLTENKNRQCGVIWFKQDVFSPFRVRFKFKIGGGTGADGLVFMFYKKKDYIPVNGGDLGFITLSQGVLASVPGYGIEFDTYINGWDPSRSHIALIKDSMSNHLAYAINEGIRDNQWHNAEIIVGESSVEVYIDNTLVLTWKGAIDRTYGGLGFSAATGASNDWHIIDDVWITTESSPQERENKPPTLTLDNPQVNGLTVTINGAVSPGYSGASISRIHWEWGDGSSGDSGFPATHTYSKAGTYTITVTVYQSDGLTTKKTVTVTVQELNKHPTLILYSLYDPQVSGLTVTIGGGALPGYSGASITRIHWEWGDGKSDDSSAFPATHTYNSPGTYTITVTAYQSDGLSTAKSIIITVKKSLNVELAADATTLVEGKQVLIFVIVKDAYDHLTDATVNCKVLTPMGREIPLILSWLSPGMYKATFAETTEVGDYHITVTAQAQAGLAHVWVSDTKELTFHVLGKGEYGIINIHRTSCRVFWGPGTTLYEAPLKLCGPSEAIIKVDGEVTKEDDQFNIDLSLTNTRDYFYDLSIYEITPIGISSKLYEGWILPGATLYPISIKTRFEHLAIHVEWQPLMEFVKVIIDLIHPILSVGVEELKARYALLTALTSSMKQSNILPKDYDSMPVQDQIRQWVIGLKKLYKNNPDYVVTQFQEFFEKVGMEASKECIEEGIETWIRREGVFPILEAIFDMIATPNVEDIIVDIGKTSPSSMPSRASLGAENFLFAVNSLKPLNGATDSSLQKYLGSTVLAGASNPQFESNTTGSVTINLFKDRLTYNLDTVFPVSEQLALGSTDIFSMASNGVRKGEFIIANATINFVFSDNENASYFFEIVNSSSPIRETVLKLMGFNVVWNPELHINGSSVYLRATGLKPASPGLTREDWTEVVKAGQVSLHIFREFEVQNVGNNSYITRRLISPEVFSVASAYSNRIIVRLFTASKIGVLGVDPKPTFCEGDPEVGYECSWSQVPEELTLSYIVDEAPPVISKIEQDPKKVTFENDVTITVNVSDIGVGLKNVTVAYSTDNGATWKKLKAEQVAGDIRQGYFKAVIPKQPYGTSVAYKLEIYDRAGNAEQSDTITYQVELAPWVYGLLILVIILVIIIGYKVYHTRHQHFA